MLCPDYLKKGDTVAILSTARTITREKIDIAIEILQSWGLYVVIGKTIKFSDNQFAGTDNQRAEDFQKALNDSSVKAIWNAKGGYGTARILDILDFSILRSSPKWIIGFSDFTALLSKFYNLGVISIHGTMPISIKDSTYQSVESLQRALFGREVKYEIPYKINFKGIICGKLVGGNLSVLYSLLGSETSIDTKDTILFIEDLDEYLYHIDRMILNLKRNGYLKGLKALLVGGMTNMHDNAVPFGKTVEEIIKDYTKEYSYPVIFNVPSGHISNNCALYIGKEMLISTDKNKIILSYNV